MDQFRRAGLTFDVRDSGPDGAEAVVLLHGFPQDSTSWSSIEPQLNAAGLRTLAPDQRGYSPGARPSGRRAYTSAELGADILALLDQAGVESAHIVGHDWGGGVAWQFAGDHPDRVLSLTVLSTPHPAAMVRAMRTGTQGLKSWYMFAVQLPWVPERVLAWGIAPMLQRTGLPKAAAQHNARRMSEPGALTGALNWYRALPFSLRTPAHRSKVPTTYIWGSRDQFLGRRAAEITKDYVISGSYTFLELDADHWLPENEAQRVSAAILAQIKAVS